MKDDIQRWSRTVTTERRDEGPKRSSEPFIAAHLPEGELEEILRRIEENLEFRRVMGFDEPRFRNSYLLPALPSPPAEAELAEADAHLVVLRGLGAPFFGPAAGAFRRSRSAWLRPLYFLLNVPLRLFGRRQHGYNNELLAASRNQLSSLQETVAYLHGLDPFLRGVASNLRALAVRAAGEEPDAREVVAALRAEIQALRATQAVLELEIRSLRDQVRADNGGESASAPSAR